MKNLIVSNPEEIELKNDSIKIDVNENDKNINSFEDKNEVYSPIKSMSIKLGLNDNEGQNTNEFISVNDLPSDTNNDNNEFKADSNQIIVQNENKFNTEDDGKVDLIENQIIKEKSEEIQNDNIDEIKEKTEVISNDIPNEKMTEEQNEEITKENINFNDKQTDELEGKINEDLKEDF